jgi:hypothetical protein
VAEDGAVGHGERIVAAAISAAKLYVRCSVSEVDRAVWLRAISASLRFGAIFH